MVRKHAARLLVITLIPLWISACNLPTSRTTEAAPTQTLPANPAHTAAAETIIAQLTLVSNPASPTPPPPTPAAATETPADTPAVLPTGTAEETPAAESTVETPLASGTEAQDAEPTAGAAAEPTATLEASPTATYIPGDPRIGLGDPTWRDTFETGENWSLYVDRYAAFEIKDSDLVMTSYDVSSRNAWMLTVPRPENYYLEVQYQPQACSGLDRYGVIFRSDATEGYIYAFSCDGRYTFRVWNGTRANVLVDWTESEHILDGPEETNRLGLKVAGDQFSLYANGNLLTQVSDGSYDTGGFGVLIGAENTQDFTVKVQEVAFWELP